MELARVSLTSWPPRVVVIQSPSLPAGAITGDQASLSLDYVADPVTALLELDRLAPDALIVPTDVVGVSVPDLVSGVCQWSEVPVLVALGHDAAAATVAAEAVAAGCHGLLSVPLTTVGVAARVGEVLGRQVQSRARGVLAVPGLKVDLDGMRVLSPTGREVTLSSLQFACLVRLLRTAPAFMATEELADELGLLGTNAAERTRQVVHRLRRRLIEAGCATDLLETVRGQGYRLRA
ncbi:winged helix-turn-helix domain-containing protein [Ornithinimicrobium cryptoxanthini]|uniref:Winged helix-turn-helix domain-containing protein n=1 Tax=Ornithinimicrobium cryptoxanthini TaxID=2934161 RepID=A0ABY4YIP4_9MICO|nr:winged helix-turn-helix domain-containing protein [Ornithinimicrobium cryptoxanthini]USQ76660.1 winged helix-turn-helix domain-containing protein [Ornithinimicrobium cryptoxanthini]